MLRLDEIFTQMVVRRTLQIQVRSRYPAQAVIYHLYAAWTDLIFFFFFFFFFLNRRISSSIKVGELEHPQKPNLSQDKLGFSGCSRWHMRVFEQVCTGSAWEELLLLLPLLLLLLLPPPLLLLPLFLPLAFFLRPLLLPFLQSLPKIFCGLNEGCLWLLPLLLMTLQLLLNITQSSHKGVVLVFLLIQLSSGFHHLLQQRGFLLLPAEVLGFQQILCLFQGRCDLPGFHSVFLKLGLMGSLRSSHSLILPLQSLLQVFYGLNEGCLFLPPPNTMAVYFFRAATRLSFMCFYSSSWATQRALDFSSSSIQWISSAASWGARSPADPLPLSGQMRCSWFPLCVPEAGFDGKPEIYPQPCLPDVAESSSLLWPEWGMSFPATTQHDSCWCFSEQPQGCRSCVSAHWAEPHRELKISPFPPAERTSPAASWGAQSQAVILDLLPPKLQILILIHLLQFAFEGHAERSLIQS